MRHASLIGELDTSTRGAFEEHDREFAAVLGPDPRLVRVVSTDAHEGPVYAAAEDALYFTTLPHPTNMPAPGFPQVAIKRLALDGQRFPLEPERVSVVREPTQAANGMTLDREGRLVICEQGPRAEQARVAGIDLATGCLETVVDAWGHVLQLRRTDGAQIASDQVAIDKARTAALFVRPSREIEEQVSGGRLGALALRGAAALTGGIPLRVDGEVVGAVGVSGASSADEDQELAALGADAAGASDGRAEVAFFPREAVVAKFETGGLLLDTPRYKADAGRRTAPGEVEYHEHVADIMHVVEGSATVVTGGDLRDAREVGPGEVRAGAVEDGAARQLGSGDVLVIPAGVPHQFVAVSDPFLYFVAKVAE
jgi:uncharacterized protein GlcG (DUF336 family)